MVVTRRSPGLATLAVIGLVIGMLFAALFRLRSLGPLDFWWWMFLNIGLGVGLAAAADRGLPARVQADLADGPARKILLGVLSAALLYGLFAAGRLVSLQLFPFAAAGIGEVYRFKEGAGVLRIVLLLGLAIGPGEELFWRGFLQENSAVRLGRRPGFALVMLVYTLVHVASGNIMLVLSAAACGVFWGWLYLKFRSPLLNAVSHTAWDLMIFIVRPL